MTKVSATPQVLAVGKGLGGESEQKQQAWDIGVFQEIEQGTPKPKQACWRSRRVIWRWGKGPAKTILKKLLLTQVFELGVFLLQKHVNT